MADKLHIDRVWWRNVQLGEFYNIERYHKIPGGGGSLYIEIPGSMVRETLNFLNLSEDDIEKLPISIEAKTIGDSSRLGTITFDKKSGNRMRIVCQNRQQPNSQRHPAWSQTNRFPKAPDNIGSKAEAEPYFPKGGLRIFIARTKSGEYYAGFTQGDRPKNMQPNDPNWDLFSQGNRPRGGIIFSGGGINV